MEHYDIRNIYNQKGREAALAAYPQAIADNAGNEQKLNELAFLAADFAHPEALKLLFEAGVSPTITDHYGFTLLHYLARRPESTHHFHPAGAVAETTAFLLDNKVSALRKDEDRNMTCYHYAARNGLADMVKVLAERGVKLNMTDKEGNTGIHIACDYVKHAMSNIGIKKRELENAQKNYADTVTRLKARDMSDEDIARYINNNMTNTPEQAQKHYDAAVQKVEDFFRLVKIFAEGGVDIDEKNAYGQTALDFAVKHDAKKIAAYLSGTLTDENDSAAVAAGGMTLHQAAEKGDTDAIKAIVATGADINALKDDSEYNLGKSTALAIATAYLQVQAVEALLACGADPSFKDGNGRAAVSYLLETRASVHSGTFNEKLISKIVKDMLSAGMNVNIPVDDDGNTLLLLACKASRSGGYNHRSIKGDVIDEIMKHNPDINLTNRFGETALMHTCARDFDMMENVQLMLLEQGADVAAADKNGDTALHYAARNDNKTGAKTLCDMLLEFGADVNAVNNAEKTALDIATETDNEPLVKLLLAKM